MPLLLVLFLSCSLNAFGAGKLEQEFKNPPKESRPFLFWDWMHDLITKKGISNDLDAFEEGGCGGALIMLVGAVDAGFNPVSNMDAPLAFYSDRWFETWGHAAREADRLGLRLITQSGTGWCHSGGPWVKGKDATQHLASSEVMLRGPISAARILLSDKEAALVALGYHAALSSTSTQKWLQLDFEEPVEIDRIVLHPLNHDGVKGFGFPLRYRIILSEKAEKDSEFCLVDRSQKDVPNPGFRSVVIDGKKRRARSIRLEVTKVWRRHPTGGSFCFGLGELQVFSNGKNVAPTSKVTAKDSTENYGWSLKGLTDSKRLALDASVPSQGPFILAAPSSMTRDIAIVAFPDENRKPVAKREIVELTARVENGTLRWDVPAGDWIVRRIVMKNAHSYTRVPPRGGEGLECDKLSKGAVQANFDGMVGRFLSDNPELAGRSIWGVESDSWEVGHPEWSPGFREEFRKRRGYDPVPWVVSLKGGPVVESQEMTARFRSDWEQTKVDLFADHYFSNMQQIANEHGMRFLAEAYYGPFDPVTCGGRTDVPMGEYWASGDCLNSMRWAASSSHVYGRKLTAAEAYTGRPEDGLWAVDPYSLKRIGDTAFCYGLNMNIIHGMGHNPWDEKWKPSMPLGFWGSMVGPRQTWWKPGRAWMDYLARCQHMLRQGRAVVDVLYVFPNLHWNNTAPSGLHKKFNYDLCSEELLVNALEWKDGRFVLPSGMEYRVLVMPPFQKTVKRQILRKLIRLVEAGGTVVVQGRPERTPGLEDYPKADQEIRQLVHKLWGDCDGKRQLEHRLGQGRLVWMNTWSETADPETKYILSIRNAYSHCPFYSKPAHTVVWSDSFVALLEDLGVRPDVEVRESAGKPVQGVAMAMGGQKQVAFGVRQGEDVFAWTHRRDGDCEIYFVASQVAEKVSAELAFRVKGKQPEIWDPVSGNIEPAGYWREEDGQTIVPLCFHEYDSKFVVFRKPGSPSGKLGMHQRDLFEKTAKPGALKPLTIEGPWTVTFPEGWGAPERVSMPLKSWTEHSQEGVRFFSGTATYMKTIHVPEEFCGKGRSIWLDLGQVKNLAELDINGRKVGVLWKPPFRVEITDLLKPGANRLSIRVTNTWINRLVGDEHYPDDCQWNPPQQHIGFPVGQSIRAIPKWIWSGDERPEPRRKTFTTWKFYTKDTPLPESGLLGPVRLVPLPNHAAIRRKSNLLSP